MVSRIVKLTVVDRDEFCRMVSEALAEIPPEFAAKLENVEVVVEDEPSPAELRRLRLDPRRATLFGLYEGVPLRQRGFAYAGLPDKITIFYGPLTRAFRDPRALRRQIQATVVHEIAHHFGLDERRVRDLGY